MLHRFLPLLLMPVLLPGASDFVRVQTTDGTVLEGAAQTRSVKLAQILSIHNGAPATDSEAARITAGLAAIQGTDRAARDKAVEELTAIGLPVMTPLLKAYKDTDQHEPRPLYRLFERIMPSYADEFDRTKSMTRMATGEAVRGPMPTGTIEVNGTAVDWSKVRSLAVRQKAVKRTMAVHSLKHSTQIEFLDSGVILTAASKATLTAKGFVRLSWETDSWASDANGLKVPGSPAYKSNLVDGHPFGALVARVEPAGEVFFVGKSGSVSGKAGRLRLAINDNAHWQNNLGTYYVTMTASDAYDLGDPQ
jgi:hypothetical protein